MSDTFIQWIVGQTGTAGVAILALFMLRQAYEDRDKRRVEAIGKEEQRSDQLIEVIKENTKVAAQLVAAVAQVGAVIGNCALAQGAARLRAQRAERELDA